MHPKVMKVAKTAPQALKSLWKGKIFLKAKDFRSIEQVLEKRGYNFTEKNLLMALKSARFLTRRGNKGNYKYIQKHPFIEEDENEKHRRNK